MTTGGCAAGVLWACVPRMGAGTSRFARVLGGWVPRMGAGYERETV